MAQVGGSAGDQVVDRENFPAAIEEVVAQMRPEKSRASRDYRAQRAGLSMQMFSGRLRFFMIPSFLTRSNLADTLNFIVAAAVLCTKSGSADQSRSRNSLRERPHECDEDSAAPQLTSNGHRVTIPSPPYDDVPRPILFAAMLSVLQQFGRSPFAPARTVRIGHSSIFLVAAFSLRGLHQATL